MTEAIAIILNWRDAVSTVDCIKSIFYMQQPLSIIVVDNDSGDGSFEVIKKYVHDESSEFGYKVLSEEKQVKNQVSDKPWIFAISSGRNGGYAFGNNVGIKIALENPSCRYVWILNADILIPSAATFRTLIAYMNVRRDIGICGATVCYADEPIRIQTLAGGAIDKRGRTSQFGQGRSTHEIDHEIDIEGRLDYINGACSFVRRELIETVGLMSEKYFLYFEELDWSARSKPYFKLGYCKEAIVLHHVGKSIGTSDNGSRSRLSAYYMNSSQLRYCIIHLKSAVPWVICNQFLEVLRNVRHGRWGLAAAIGCAMLRVPAKQAKALGVL